LSPNHHSILSITLPHPTHTSSIPQGHSNQISSAQKYEHPRDSMCYDFSFLHIVGMVSPMATLILRKPKFLMCYFHWQLPRMNLPLTVLVTTVS
jgi:hypothetical protein